MHTVSVILQFDPQWFEANFVYHICDPGFQRCAIHQLLACLLIDANVHAFVPSLWSF